MLVSTLRRFAGMFITAAVLATLLLTLSCGAAKRFTGGIADFSKTVFVGDWLTAGFQNGSLLDTQQPHGWAPLVAAQAKFSIRQPLIAAPGVPAVLNWVASGRRRSYNRFLAPPLAVTSHRSTDGSRGIPGILRMT